MARPSHPPRLANKILGYGIDDRGIGVLFTLGAQRLGRLCSPPSLLYNGSLGGGRLFSGGKDELVCSSLSSLHNVVLS
jgi:hypothetical protein